LLLPLPAANDAGLLFDLFVDLLTATPFAELLELDLARDKLPILA